MSRLPLLVLVAGCLLLCSSTVSASGGRSGLARTRHLLQASAPPPAPTNASVSADLTAAANGTFSNATDVTSNGTALNTTVAVNATSPPPPESPASTSPETTKEKLHDKWEELESGKSSAEKGVAITIGVLMLVCMLTCLACCVFRRGGQWRVPGLQWFKRKFGPKDRYSRYADANDDGF